VRYPTHLLAVVSVTKELGTMTATRMRNDLGDASGHDHGNDLPTEIVMGTETEWE